MISAGGISAAVGAAETAGMDELRPEQREDYAN